MHKKKFDWGRLVVPAVVIWVIWSCIAAFSPPSAAPNPAPPRPTISLPPSRYDSASETAQAQLTQEVQDTQLEIWESQETQQAGGCPNGCTSHVAGCDIKGNISIDSGTKIYHLPGMEYYDATSIDPSYGERWFCTTSEAEYNGWRRSSQ